MRPSLWHPCRDLSVTSSALRRASPTLPVSFSWPLARVFTGWSGSEDAEIAKPTDCAFSWKPTPRFGLGCLLSLGTLHRIRWPLQPRSRDPLTAFGDGRTAKWHSRATLGLRPDLSLMIGVEAGNPDIPFARRTRPQVPPTAVHFELGPRSLDPAAVFAARMPSLFETRCRLTTSATALRRASNQTWTPAPRRDDGLDHLPFLPHHDAHRWAVTRGEPRSVRFCRPRCWFFPVTRVCPAAMPPVALHHRRVAPSVHSEDWRARVGGPSERRVPFRTRRCPVRAFGAYAYECVGRRRSSPRLPTGHPLSPARSIPAEEAADTKNEPTKALIPTTHREACRLPEDRDALGRHDTRRILREEIALPGLRAGSLAHAAHTFSPGWGECFVGPCKYHGAVTRDPWWFHPQVVREYRRLWYSLRHAWDWRPKHARKLDRLGRRRELIAPLAPMLVAAPRRLLRA